MIIRKFQLLLLMIGWVSLPLPGQPYPWIEPYDSSQALCRRISPPNGFERVSVPEKSFAGWLRRLPLKPGRPLVYLYNGIEKPNQKAHHAVVNIDVGKSDLQQCADAVMRLRAEYLYSVKAYEKIHFNFTSGDRIDFINWMKGYRPIVKEDAVIWLQSGNKDLSYHSFRDYLTQIFIYAGSYSLSRELTPVEDVREMSIGDVFIRGGFPGHAVMVADMAENPRSGEKLFLLLQSYMPAQDIHVLINPNDSNLSPWYSLDFGDSLVTPEWTFAREELMRF